MNTTVKISSLLLFISLSLFSQNSYITREGEVSFFSSAPLEDIEAVNNRVHALLENTTGEVAVRMRIEDFRFEKALMQKHFNEKYMESHIYPEARFTGIIEDFAPVADLKSDLTVTINGSLTVHGVTRQVEISGTLGKAGPHLTFKTQFPVRVEDYGIRIPRLLIRNIAEEVEVTINFRMAPIN